MKTVKTDIKVCGVCGDKALGYNFNAITCESCKAFFRRNALITKPLKCPFNNQCDITTLTRRFCQKCRLEKCFSIGMCKDLIMTEQDKVAKRQKIEENRVRRENMGKFKSGCKKIKREDTETESQYTTDSDTNTDHPSPLQNMSDYTNFSLDSMESSICSPIDRYIPSNEETTLIKNSPKTDFQSTDLSKKIENDTYYTRLPNVNNNISNNVPNNNINNNNNTDSLKHTSCLNNSHMSSSSDRPENCDNVTSSDDVPPLIIDMYSNCSGEGDDTNPMDSIMREAIQLEFQAFSSLSQIQSNSRELNDAERAKLNELIVANKALLTPVDEEYGTKFENSPFEKVDVTPALVDVINLTTIYIRRLIKMAKKVSAFRNMCQEDQVALLKGGCTEVMIVRSAMNYDTKKQSWRIPHSRDSLRVNSKVLKLINKGTIYHEHEKFIKTFSPLWNGDENIILILCMIVLFSPDRPKVIHQEVIKLEQNSYYYLLRRYLESIHSGCEAKSVLLKLMQKLVEVRKVNEELITAYLNSNPSDIEPLLIEIFDLHR